MVLSIFIFVCTQLNCFKYCYLISMVQSIINHLFSHNKTFRPLNFIHKSCNPPGPTGPLINNNKGIIYMTQNFKTWSLTMRWFNDISGTLVVDSNASAVGVYISSPKTLNIPSIFLSVLLYEDCRGVMSMTLNKLGWWCSNFGPQ